ncbi:phenylalanine--tRNA ligase beta subunit-related protein [Micromonospora sp. C28SCA-DRY-2]|uniref:B3/B4 domain-containing protein n=1 Tax=Micromonospora sp. C28SCA-DRY-2 TaxID=3059522 RepID=UPI002675609E|nr:phenylalanine--tRNA ligase beta subunit-related protein [Micromonospora sp. C28SCA-DRY-2]MDO3704943.1 phenylalanine--tRNA ligase beta subunit-related protein [Micromonospora sp. C28SCA-DRY-2]
MYFQHSPEVWAAHPGLVAGLLYAEGVAGKPRAELPLAELHAVARDRLAGGTEASFPEIQAWRRAFARMGLAPTRYRCASESLLRRLRTEGDLPEVHPLVDLGNAVSAAYAIPVGILDVTRIGGGIEVRPARGDESYLTFAGAEERPDPGEVIFADPQGRAHARRWTNRQSGWSAVRDDTASILVVVEAMHEGAGRDVPRVLDAIAAELRRGWSAPSRTTLLTPAAPRFEF